MLRFVEGANRWGAFYERYGIALTEPNQQGWSNFNCVLPTHRTEDTEAHGGVNVVSGSYRCWADSCRRKYVDELGKHEDSSTLRPWEFLVLVHEYSVDDARRVVSEYIHELEQRSVEEVAAFEDAYLSRTYPGVLPGVEQFVREAEHQLEAGLAIVEDYCQAKGLRFETLQRFGCGFSAEHGTEEGSIILPYLLDNRVVGLRARTIDGRKGALVNSWFVLYNLSRALQSKSKILVVVEGETDCLRVAQMLQDHGIEVPVVSTPGAYFRPEWSRHIQQYTQVVYIPQADRAAQRLLNDLRRALGRKLRVINLPWKAGNWGKDIAEFLLQNSEDELLEALRLQPDREETPRILTSSRLLQYAEKEIEWVVPELIERGTKTLLVGPPKTYKTWIALGLCKAVSHQESFLGVSEWTPNIENARCVLIEQEGALSRLGRRWAMMEPRDDDVFFMHRQPISLDDSASCEALYEDLRSLEPDLVVFDPLADLHSQDENTVQGIQLVMLALNEIVVQMPKIAIMVVHHTPKAGGGARGSSALFASVDSMLEVLPGDMPDTIRLMIHGRDIPAGYGENLAFEFSPTTGLLQPLAGITVAQNTNNSLDGRILTLMAETAGEWWQCKALSAELGTSESTIRARLEDFVTQGLVETTGRGTRGSPKQYRVPTQ